ncbi:hypothetical protein BABINDRAFT_58302 [Babjeviella inositovora NRRL Y-12698]|uniref:AAA+ ATPase domain-containing protein n=1 Tax=Babjeviella inositovora NRRL Y-12698 TaxID=984486 RepID=A0A1E3QVM8_9ASCO|nr:uncharacterized protein BABINDRAFT_58302 [Babjeviella inositovora NRRL Y-12698]ODQ81703.1 hypothetical protein BABINDRAFT_58302 [Babjeviella inositovora NRRL Y-12698]
MSLWVDKYRPKSLEATDYHPEIADRLKALASSSDFPHLLVYGPPGAGKKTRILATLQQLYGPAVEKMKIDVRQFQTASNRKLEFNVVSSSYHLEITPSDMGNNDRVVIQDLLKEVAQTEQVDFSGKHRFKVVIINEADSLTRDAQAALRRTMEKYSGNIRLVLLSNTTSNIIPPIKSRCLLVRVAAPSEAEVATILDKVCKKESVSVVETERSQVLQLMAAHSGRNLRKALLLLEAMVMQNDHLSLKTPVIQLDWEGVIRDLTASVLKERSVAKLQLARTVFYELLSHCIPAKVILKTVCWELLRGVQRDSLKVEIIELASVFDERLSLGQKAIFHLEGFLAKVMVAMEQ